MSIPTSLSSFMPVIITANQVINVPSGDITEATVQSALQQAYTLNKDAIALKATQSTTYTKTQTDDIVSAQLSRIATATLLDNVRCTLTNSANNIDVLEWVHTATYPACQIQIATNISGYVTSYGLVSFSLYIDGTRVCSSNFYFNQLSQHVSLPKLSHCGALTAGSHTFQVRINDTNSPISKAVNIICDGGDFCTMSMVQHSASIVCTKPIDNVESGTTSGDNADVTAWVYTASFIACNILVSFDFSAYAVTTGLTSYSLYIDNVRATSRNFVFNVTGSTTTVSPLHYCGSLSAGSHTFQIRLNDTTSPVAKVVNMSQNGQTGTMTILQY